MVAGGVNPDTAMKWPLPKLVSWASIVGDQKAIERLGRLYDTRAAQYNVKDFKKYAKELDPDG